MKEVHGEYLGGFLSCSAMMCYTVDGTHVVKCMQTPLERGWKYELQADNRTNLHHDGISAV